MIEYEDINNPVQEKSNMGGVWQDVYAAPQSDFASFASVPSEDGNRDFSTMNILSVGADALKPGKKLIKIYGSLEKGSLEAERQGEIDGISHKVSLKFFVPGLKSESLALLKIPNQNWIFYVRTGNQMFRVGGDRFAAKLAASGKVGTGAKTADAKGNELEFNTYEDGFCPEVSDINAILAMLNPVDTGLTVVFSPAHAATGVLVDANLTITFGEAVVDALTNAAFTSQSMSAIVELNKLDVGGNVVSAVPFVGGLSGNVFTVNPTSDLSASAIYELKFNATRVVSSDAKGRINGSNFTRFITA